jgi:hypothetical protein
LTSFSAAAKKFLLPGIAVYLFIVEPDEPSQSHKGATSEKRPECVCEIAITATRCRQSTAVLDA